MRRSVTCAAVPVLVLLLGSVVLGPTPAWAGGIYKYTEKDGTIVYTNVPPGKPRGASPNSSVMTMPRSTVVAKPTAGASSVSGLTTANDPPRAEGRASPTDASTRAEPSHVEKLEGEFHAAPSPSVPAQITSETKVAMTAFDDMIREAAIRYKMPLNLVRAVMHAESNFDPGAVSVVGASGLMQLMPQTAQEMYVKDIFSVRDNIEGGVRYLRVLANEFNGDMIKMVAAYNAGPEAVRRYNGQVPPFPETQAYVKKVLTLYYQYKAQELARAEPAPKDR